MTTPASKIDVVFFYCNGNYIEMQDIRYILGSFLQQLMSSHIPVSCCPEMAAIRELQKSRIATRREVIDTLVSSFQMISKNFDRLYVVVDGIDECADDRSEIISILRKLVTKNVYLLMTSGPEKDIAEAMNSCEQLIMEHACVNTDIATYIEWELNYDRKLRCMNEGQKDEVKEKLLFKGTEM